MPSPPSSAGLHAVTSRQCAWPANPDDEAAGYAAEQRQWELEARRPELSPGASMFDAEMPLRLRAPTRHLGRRLNATSVRGLHLRSWDAPRCTARVIRAKWRTFAW